MTNSKINDKELDKIAGGQEPEEFDWKTKGYVTPIKPQSEGSQWNFEAIGDSNKHITNDHTISDIQNKK